MRRSRSFVPLFLLVAIACSDANAPLSLVGAPPADALGDPPRKVVVTNAADSGAGSFRAALEEASADPAVTTIAFKAGLGTLVPSRPLTFTGIQWLMIDASSAVIDGSRSTGDVLVFNTSASLTLFRLTIHGAANGVAMKVNVAASATGTLSVMLNQVHLQSNAQHALLVNDLTGFLEDPNTTSSAGSAASMRVDVVSSSVGYTATSSYLESGTVHGMSDQDAIRINEGGEGNVVVNVRTSEFGWNGDDDIQVVERGNGNADVNVDGSFFTGTAWTTETGAGDALRVDEADAGSVNVRATGTQFTDGRGQAIELSENGAGHLYLYSLRSTMFGGEGARVVAKEDDRVEGGGNLTVDLADDTHIANNGPWYGREPDPMNSQLIIHEKGEGNVDARITRAGVNGGTYSGGMLVREDAGGSLRATMRTFGNYGNAHHGLILDENGAGDLIAALTEGYVAGNGGNAIEASQEAPGTGSLSLTAMQLFENGGPSGDTPLTTGQITVRYF